MKDTGFSIWLLLVGVILVTVFTYSFFEITEGFLESEITSFDTIILEVLDPIGGYIGFKWMILITELGSAWFLTTMSVICILIIWLRNREVWVISFFIIAVGGGGLLIRILKYIYQRERPSINSAIDAIGYSFPSGHGMGSLIFYGFLTYIILGNIKSKAIKWSTVILVSILVLLIGLSRVYLGAHYPSDVAAGYLAGAVWLMFNISALEWLKIQSQNKNSTKSMNI
ncbi:undecaprenyl-diphosphatase [Metabacillus crassostreae]|uniref:phosphatase PAP2 family protein n=1 Tax=Metabacillus crassostreae TaxID=929098 RepID=UPI0019575B83|nr:phosphatase PAP2 family protein [Metabacillus crassostreae]MBM7605142.1 undecaprenyl-diphosphatase [Metabacillus crassostreae]